jgi:hypothetical protein
MTLSRFVAGYKWQKKRMLQRLSPPAADFA